MVKAALRRITPGRYKLDEKARYAGLNDTEFTRRGFVVPPIVLVKMKKALSNGKEELEENPDSEVQVDKLEFMLEYLSEGKVQEFQDTWNNTYNWTMQLVSDEVYNWVAQQ